MKRISTSPSILLLISIAIIFRLTPESSVQAQNGGQDEPYYVVKAGDSLWEVASRFGVSLADLQLANNISEPSQVVIGARLLIPGLQGINGQVDTTTIAYGETLRSLSRRYDLSQAALAQANRLVNPAELYAGATLIVPFVENQNSSDAGRTTLGSGQSLLVLAVLRGDDPWKIALDNNLSNTWSAVPGGVLNVAGESPADAPDDLPEAITKVEVDPLVMLQGGTEVVKVYAPPGVTLRGSLAGRNLNFFPQDYGYVALQGIHALTAPGLYPLSLDGELPTGDSFAFSQNVLVKDAKFPYDPSLTVDPATIDPAVTVPEQKLWESLGVPVTPTKMWNGQFVSPVPKDFTNCWTSLFGDRRSYNGGTYDSFHSGLDFCGRVGTDLYAVAPGKVTYTNMLTVRGGVVVIDHGWGVYTAYDHLSKILVQAGDTVQPGQLVGLGGATGRTTGPHLHWEVWVGGVQVNPVDWLNRAYP